MIKLDEKDIKVVATSRYYRKRRWWLVGGGLLAVIIGFVLLFYLPSSGWQWISITPLLIYTFYIFVIDNIKCLGSTKEFIASWKKEGVS